MDVRPRLRNRRCRSAGRRPRFRRFRDLVPGGAGDTTPDTPFRWWWCTRRRATAPAPLLAQRRPTPYCCDRFTPNSRNILNDTLVFYPPASVAGVTGRHPVRVPPTRPHRPCPCSCARPRLPTGASSRFSASEKRRRGRTGADRDRRAFRSVVRGPSGVHGRGLRPRRAATGPDRTGRDQSRSSSRSRTATVASVWRYRFRLPHCESMMQAGQPSVPSQTHPATRSRVRAASVPARS